MAELALVLAMIFLGSQAPQQPRPAAGGDPGQLSATPSPAATPQPSPTPTVGRSAPGLTPTPQSADVRMASKGDHDAARRLAAAIVEQGHGQRVGMILLFGVTFDANTPAGGDAVAEAMRGMLLAEPGLAQDPPVIDCYHQFPGPDHPLGQVVAKVFYYA